MASKTIEKGSIDWQMFTEFWNLYKTFGIPEDNDEYWQNVIDAAGKFHKKYGTAKSKSLATCLFNILEGEHKEMNNQK